MDKHRDTSTEEILQVQSAVVRNMAEGVCLIKVSNEVIAYANPKFTEMFGYDLGELEGQHVSVLNADSPGQGAGEIATYLNQTIREKGSYSYEVHNRKKDGTPFWCRATTSLIDHPTIGALFVAVHEDITERKKHEEDLLKSEKRYRDVIDLASDGIFETGPDGNYLDVNPAGCAMLGYAREEIVGRSALDLVADEDREKLATKLNELALSGGSHLIVEFGVKCKNGVTLAVEVSVKALPDGRRISFLRDLTFRKRAEAAIAASERRYRSLFEGAYDSILVANAEGKIVLINDQLGRKFGYTMSELVGQPIEILIPERFRTRHILNREDHGHPPRSRAMGAGLDLYALKKDGSEFPVDISLSPVQTQEGLRITAIIRDITERKRHEDQQAFLSQLAKSLNDVMDFEQRAQIVAEGLIEKLADTCVVRIFDENRLLPKGIASRDKEREGLLKKAIASGAGLHGRYGALEVVKFRKTIFVEEAEDLFAASSDVDPRLKGTVLDLGVKSYVSIPLIAAGNVTGTLTVLMSISGRKFSANEVIFLEIVANRCAVAIENARLYRQAQIAKVVSDNMPALIAYWDKDEKCRFANRVYVEWFGLTPEQLLGRHMQDVLGKPLYEKNFPYIKAALEGKVQSFERDLTMYKSGELRHTQAIYLPEVTSNEVQGFFVLVTDVTELKRAQMLALLEKERAESAVRLREEVLGIVSHDLRNPLAAIDMAAQLLSQGQPNPQEVLQYADRIRASTGAMQKLIADLLDFGKIQAGAFTVDRKVEDVAVVVNAAMDAMNAKAAAKKVHLLTSIEPKCPDIFADRNRIVQVIWNLVGNAIKFTPEGGTVSLSAETDGDTIRFSISDTGPGIAPNDLPNIFDRFWQAKKTATLGTGLGLAIAKGIVSAHGGRIWVNSETKKGAQFHFMIPTANENQREIKKIESHLESFKIDTHLLDQVHVLVVDDSQENLTLLRIMLEKSGARVTEALCLKDALKELSKKLPDLLITDIEMPEGSGYDLINKLHELSIPKDRLPVAALTGHTDKRELKKINDAGFDAYLSKPITAHELVSLVSKLSRQYVHH